jgi:replicative DNA helicase
LGEAYREDLAYIHDAGFGHFARGAAALLLEELPRQDFDRGLVVDLGCGSGILAEPLAARGFEILGIDLSAALIALARNREPGGLFRVESLLMAQLPRCVAVAAVGECVNYLFDERHSWEGVRQVLGRAFGALAPGGLLLLDVAEPGRVPGGRAKSHAEGEGWAVLVTAEEDRQQGLVTPTLKAAVCNIEMPPSVLLDRQLARLSGIDLSLIRHRRLTEAHADRIARGLHTLDALADRLAFVRPPYTLDNVAATADAFRADVLLLDYIQRIAPPGNHTDRRGAVDATMNYLRQFAEASVAVIVVAAVARSRDSKGRSSYSEGLSLASFRESSELEFGADDAFILAPDPDAGDDPDAVLLRHLKSRHGEAADLPLRFERRYQHFASAGAAPTPADRRKLQSDLAALWDQTRPAGDDGDGT